MKPLKYWSLGCLSLFCCAILSAQSLNLKKVSHPPETGTYYLATGVDAGGEPAAPFPFDPYQGRLPVYEVTPGHYLIADTEEDLAIYEATHPVTSSLESTSRQFSLMSQAKPPITKAQIRFLNSGKLLNVAASNLTMGAMSAVAISSVNRVTQQALESNARTYDPQLQQQSDGLYTDPDTQITYAIYTITGFEPNGYYFVTSKNTVQEAAYPVWTTHKMEGWLQAPESTGSVCYYGIPLTDAAATFFYLGSFDGTYGGLYYPSSSITYPTNGQFVDLTTRATLSVDTAADDPQAVSQIQLTIDGQLVADRDAEFPVDPLHHEISKTCLPSGEHVLVQTVFNFGENGAPTNDTVTERMTTESEPVIITVTNDFAYINPYPLYLDGQGYSLTMETPYPDTMLTAVVLNASSNVVAQVQSLAGYDGVVSFNWDGNNANSTPYTGDWFGMKLLQPAPAIQPHYQGPSSNNPPSPVWLSRSRPPQPGQISLAYQNLGIINYSASGMLENAHAAADLMASSFHDMRPIYRDNPKRVPDELTPQQWLNDLTNVWEVWEVSHTAWGYSGDYRLPGGKPFVDGNKTDRQGLFGDGTTLVSVKQISDQLQNIWDYHIHDYYQAPEEIPIFYDHSTNGLWLTFSFKHVMSSVFLDSCYSAQTSLPMAFGIFPLLSYNSAFHAALFGWNIDEQYETGTFSKQQVHFSNTFNAAYISDPTLGVGMQDAASGAGGIYDISPKDYAVFGNPQHTYTHH